MYDIASKTPESIQNQRKLLGEYVRDLKIDSKEKLDQAITFLKGIAGQDVDLVTFDKMAGVGVDTSLASVEKAMHLFLEGRKTTLLAERY
jgi:hypothetical protein